MACRLMLVRHARTPSNEGGLLDTRVPGPYLADEGAGQAEGFGRALSARSVDPWV
jgi:broad specificity phosphatase PhoE